MIQKSIVSSVYCRIDRPSSTKWGNTPLIWPATLARSTRVANISATMLNKIGGKPLPSLKVIANIIVDFDSHTTSRNKTHYPSTPFWWNPLRAQSLWQKGPLYFVICFFEIYFEDDSIQLFTVKLMYSFMQRNNSIYYVASLHKRCLSGSDHVVSYPAQPISCHLC